MEQIDKVVAEILRESMLFGIKRRRYDYDIDVAIGHVERIAKTYAPRFILTPHVRSMYEELIKYFLADPAFKGDLNKGILLMGSTGSGKTLAMKVMNKFGSLGDIKYEKNGKLCNFGFDILSVHDVVRLFVANGFEGIDSFEKRYILCLDDIGAEVERVKHYGNDIDIIGHLIQGRCKDGILTFATSNFPETVLEEKYNDRVVSRMHEMFNFLTIREQDFRRS